MYDDSIVSEPAIDDIEPGDLAVIFDDKRKFAAIGLYDPYSPIRVKILHQGKPQTIDAEFFAHRISVALEHRMSLFTSVDTDAPTTGFRVLHGENDNLPGLVADLYSGVLVVKVYSTGWLPHLGPVMVALADQLAALLPGPLTNIVIRLSRAVERVSDEFTDGEVVLGPPLTDAVVFQENGLAFGADVIAGQKTGHFLDQRDNRQAIRHEATGDVLDVFSSTGGFSVYAAAGGAQRVVSVDQNQASVDAAAANMARNPQTASVAHELVCADAFATMHSMAKAGRSFDVVVIDPPSFAQKQSDISAATNAYRKLAELGLAVTKPGGLYLQASCSSRIEAADFYDIVTSAAAAQGITLADQRRAGHAVDHPIGFAHGAYLKALFGRVQR